MVIIIASGTYGTNSRWGHHAPDRWNFAGEQFTEIMISGEGLRRSRRDVLATLLHEAAHALAHACGIKDTSRQGRYHNKHFKNCAEEVGLTVEHDARTGWSACTITSTTELAYARQLQALTEAMTLWRHGETAGKPPVTPCSPTLPPTKPANAARTDATSSPMNTTVPVPAARYCAAGQGYMKGVSWPVGRVQSGLFP